MEKFNLPNVICLHGALGSAAQMQAALKPLLAKVNLLFVELPGHGTCADEALTIEGCVAALREFIVKENLAGTPIFGYSMGGYVALLLAKQYPELAGQIITLGTKLDWNSHFAEAETQKLKPELILEKVPKYAEGLKRWHGDAWPNVVTATAELMRNLGQNPRLTDAVYQTLQHPVLLCLADGDTMVNRDETINAAWLLPAGEFAEVPNSAHPIEKVDIEKLWEIMMPCV